MNKVNTLKGLQIGTVLLAGGFLFQYIMTPVTDEGREENTRIEEKEETEGKKDSKEKERDTQNEVTASETTDAATQTSSSNSLSKSDFEELDIFWECASPLSSYSPSPLP